MNNRRQRSFLSAAAVTTLSAILLVISALYPVPALATCSGSCIPGIDFPAYNRSLDYEPNWCVYYSGDRVFLRATITGGQYVPYEWYVVRHDNPDQQALSYTFSGAGWAVDQYVDANGCQIVSLP